MGENGRYVKGVCVLSEKASDRNASANRFCMSNRRSQTRVRPRPVLREPYGAYGHMGSSPGSVALLFLDSLKISRILIHRVLLGPVLGRAGPGRAVYCGEPNIRKELRTARAALEIEWVR